MLHLDQMLLVAKASRLWEGQNNEASFILFHQSWCKAPTILLYIFNDYSILFYSQSKPVLMCIWDHCPFGTLKLCPSFNALAVGLR